MMNWQQQRRAQATIFAQQRTVGKGNAAPPQRSVSCMHVTEQMISRFGFKHLFPQHLAAIMDGHAFYSVLVQHAQRRLVRHEHVHIGRNGTHLTVVPTLHKERNPVKTQSLQGNARMTQEMAVRIQSLDLRPMQAYIVIAYGKKLVPVGQIAQPVEEVQGFLLRAVFGEVAAMHQHIGFGQVAQTAVPVVRVGETKNGLYHIIPANVYLTQVLEFRNCRSSANGRTALCRPPPTR